YDLASAYRDHFPGRTRVFVEFEFKKTTDDALVVKQMREIPDAPVRLSEAAALINTPASLKVFQGEAGTVLANHRLKSLWQIETASRWLDEEGLSTSLVGSAE